MPHDGEAEFLCLTEQRPVLPVLRVEVLIETGPNLRPRNFRVWTQCSSCSTQFGCVGSTDAQPSIFSGCCCWYSAMISLGTHNPVALA